LKIFHQELRHPTQPSAVALDVYEQPGGGFLVTEDRRGTRNVVATLGLIDDRAAALKLASDRVDQLFGQQYKLAPAEG
jgi:hypothetical protein